MKTMTSLVGATVMALLVGCGGADDTSEQSQDMLQQGDDTGAIDGCYSTRDKKQYRAGEKVVGNHTVERCPADVKICLAPDSDSSSECQASGEWFVTTTPGYVTGGI